MLLIALLPLLLALGYPVASGASPSSHENPGAVGEVGQTYLFAPQWSTNLISVFDLNTQNLVAQIGLDGYGASSATARPDGNVVFVGDALDANLHVIDVKTMSIVDTTALAGFIDHVIPLYGGDLVWLPEFASDTVAGTFPTSAQLQDNNMEAVNAYTFKPARDCTDGIGKLSAVSVDGKWLFSLLQASPGSPLTFNVYSTDASCSPVTSVTIPGTSAGEIVVSPDGTKAYIEEGFGDGAGNGELVVMDIRNPAHPEYITTVPLGSEPLYGNFTPDGRQLWIPNSGDGTVTVVDVATSTVVHTIDTGSGYISNIAFWHDRAYFAEASSTTVTDSFPDAAACPASPPPPTPACSAYITLESPIPGILAPGTQGGQLTSRIGVDLPEDIVAYSTSTYEPLTGLPVMEIPGYTSLMAVASPTG